MPSLHQRFSAGLAELPKWFLGALILYCVLPAGARQAPLIYQHQPTRQLVATVNRAAELIARQGARAFPLPREETGRYKLLDTYVYVFTMDGGLKVDPGFPTGRERNALDHRDAIGHYFIRDAIHRLKDRESTWITYMWPRPGETTPSRKLMFTRRVRFGDETYLVVGSDLYLSHPIWLKF